MKPTIGFIQARVSSSRLPGKVLADLGGMPMILFMVDRVRRAKTLDRVVVVTSEEASDDPLAKLLADAGVDCFRGALDDVLDRFATAALHYDAHNVVRLTGDCPLIDPRLIDAVVESLIATGADYASNIAPPTYPDGMDVEAFTSAALHAAHAAATLASDREHVTPWLHRSENGMRCHAIASTLDGSSIRLTVDYPDDMALVRKIVALVDPQNFDLFDVYRVIDANPHLLEHNVHARNEGLAMSIAND